MKKYLLALSLLSSPLVHALPSQEEVVAVQTCPFELLLEQFGISPQGSPAEIVWEAQRMWMQRDRERWEYDQRFEQMKETLWPLFDQMGMLQKVEPKKQSYDYVLVVGALLSTVESRLQYIEGLGVEFGQIVFLTGERPLLPQEREKTGLETERQMVEWAYQKSNLKMPALFVDAPMKGAKRPGLTDTLSLWLAGKPTQGTYLLISSQPYLGYHSAVAEYYLREGFEGDAAGPGVKGSPSVALILDTLSRELFWRNSK